MRADRLLLLVALLRQRGRMSAPELARRLEVDQRTVLRDIEALSAAGVPVYAERGRNGGFALLPGYAPDATELTSAEAEALFVAGGRPTLERLGLADSLDSALRKLATTLPVDFDERVNHTSERLVVDEAGWTSQSSELPELAVVQRAVFTDRRLRFGYTPRPPGQAGVRTVDPYGLLLAGATWYLIAAHRGRPRSYRVSRMTSATVLEQPSDRPADLDLRALWHDMRQRFGEQAEHLFSFTVAKQWSELVLSVVGAQLSAAPEVTEDGPRIHVTGQTRAIRGVAAALAGFGSAVEIEGPPELRSVMRAIGEDLCAMYDDPPEIDPTAR